MNTSDYRSWMARAFLHLEGVLLQRAAEEQPSRVTEDFVRQGLVDGLKAARSDLANQVKTEVDVPWNRAPDVVKPSAKFGKGRSRQHDLGVKSDAKLLLACEVKWLKGEDAEAVIADLWKLALTHGVAARERDSCRTFVLVGGLRKPFQATLGNLHRRDIPLRWSPQGKATQLPRPTRIPFGSLQRKKRGFEDLKGVLRRRKTYHRQPPAIWAELRCSVVARHWKTIRGAEWKIALWELDFRAPCKKKRIEWSGLKKRLSPKGSKR